MPRRRKLLTTDEAKPTSRQHKKPCSDCPFRRDAVPGWLGSLSHQPDRYLELAHSERAVPCHSKIGPQCAGLAIYRANLYRRNAQPGVLQLPADREAVFVTPMEFSAHHTVKK